MQALEALKRTIDTVEDLQSIVRNMKVLSAVSIRQYERAVASLSDYNRTVEMGLHVLLQSHWQLVRAPQRQVPRRVGIVVFGSDHGLCGRFNAAITDFALEQLDSRYQRREGRMILGVGVRAAAALQELGHPVEDCLTVPGSAAGIGITVRRILLKLDEWRSHRGITDVALFYNVRRTGKPHTPWMLPLLPVDVVRLRRLWQRSWPSRVLPTYTMHHEQLFSALIRQYLFVSVVRACAESLASEHASRLRSMQTAEKNIEERLSELAAEYRQRRQQGITEELLDVVSGFEALTQDGGQ